MMVETSPLDAAPAGDPVQRVVIVGASAGGIATAQALRENGFSGELVLVGDEPHLPYDRPPLSKQLLSGGEEFDFVQLATDAECTDSSLTLRLGERATGLDVAASRVRIGDDHWLSYDKLVISTGVEARRLPGVEGIDGVLTLRTYDDALRLRERLTEGAHVVIVGAGFIGLEVAATARKAGCHVDVVEYAPSALKGRFPDDLTRRIVAQHEEQGVRFRFGRTVTSWQTEESAIRSVVLDDGTVIPADVVLIGIGTIPATAWAEGSGLSIDNGIVCDAEGRAADNVFAVGDVANWFDPRIGRNNRVEHRLSAGEQANVVAAVIAEQDHRGLDLPFFWTDQYEDKWQLYGYSSPDAELEIVVDDAETGRLVALLKQGDRIDAVIGRNAAKLMIPYRRDLRARADARMAAAVPS